MAGIIWQSIKVAPRLLFQSTFQPSKAVNFINQENKNQYIITWSFIFSGLLLGGVVAIPHYYLYNDIIQSVLFAFAFAFAFAGVVAFAVAVAGAGVGVVVFAGTFAGTFAFAGAFAFAFAGAVAGVFAFAGAVAGAGAVASAVAFFIITALGMALLPTAAVPVILLISAICWSIVYFKEKGKLKLKENTYTFIVITAFVLMLLAGGGAIAFIKSYDMVIYPFAFLIGYLFNSSFEFDEKNKKFKENFKRNETKDDDVTHFKFGRTQKSSLIWGPVNAILLLVPVYFMWAPELNSKLIIAAIGFSIMPIFILHIPDYLLCLPLWLFQRRKILKKYESSGEMERAYKESLLFKHERLYLQLPGLHKIMVSLATNKEIGIKEAVSQINHLYWFTFQQKQAQKAVIQLGKNRETSHLFILYLMEEKNLPLLDLLAKDNRLAALYLMLFEKEVQTQLEAESIYSRIFTHGKYFSSDVSKQKSAIPGNLEERIQLICSGMKKEKGYRFNNEMVRTLECAHKFLTAKSLKEFNAAGDILVQISAFPEDVPYFPVVEKLAVQLKKIKDIFDKIGDIQRYETKSSVLHDQQGLIDGLRATAQNTFSEPFKEIWDRALSNGAKLIREERELLRGTADLSIELKNSEILASDEERKLYFKIQNKGRELGTDISITLQSDNPGLGLPGGTEAEVTVIESGAVKEIFFPITARIPVKTTVSGTLTFSDRAREGKKISFSFPVTILEKSVGFKEIINPYIVGQPLKGDTPIFFGREDVFGFIDKNIMASGDFHSIVCHGLRRTGKSSLLYRIEEQGFTNKNLVPVNLDMQGIDDEKDFYSTLSNTIIEKLSLRSVSTAESFSQFKEFIKKIKPGLGERIIVLMIDEFEELQMRVEEKRISKIIFSNIRHLMQHEETLTFLFCGTHKLEDMSADYWSIFFNTALYRRISHLKRKDAVRLIKEPVNGQLTYDALAVEQILKMTGGQPFLTQLICHTLVNDLNENKKRNDALIDDVDDAVERIISEGTDHFSLHIWGESSVLERLILSAAAEELTQKQLDHTGVDAIFDKIKPILPGFSRKQSMETLERLVSKEILAEKNMRYRFPVNLLRKWIAARYPLRKVREEI